ncbi:MULTISPECIES: copper resistance protein NlpE [Acinetobacter]|uniref:Copper resistance protein NlpE N-terminal domain-containing protein n=1 Tax=Acinetobacter entericus TaxID=2989714 RepID=A0ABT3NE42_9GAMM|nr:MULTISPECIES: copper resistance protein NlpE [Acinetobacter]MCW8037810.1 copper resistance protein NlpE N-terminal domain-containing protein [Acinetobacter entericus]QXW25243.1 copper resistance protein NlpE N-terminal domain-containing protein [Acinetobacter johnsonii]TCB74650.1 copper resistance protein NlpE [Acinetobacter sp. ANC 4177]
MKKLVFIFALSGFALTACSKPENKPVQESAQTAPQESAAQTAESTAASQPLAAGDTAETSLDWAGEYKGVFPCADCEGIKMELELKADKTYELTEEYLGKGAGKEFKSKGSFSFDTKNPSIITLDKAAENRKFFIGENFAEARDMETGEAIDSQLNYKLTKEAN